MKAGDRATIFVQMIAVDDPECIPTIANLFACARHPERVRVGLCYQRTRAAPGLQEALASFGGAVDAVVRDGTELEGAGWARAQAQALCRSEDYTLQLHAHHRFEADWDRMLIELFEPLPGPRSVLSGWLPGYLPPDRRQLPRGVLPVAVVRQPPSASDPQIVHLCCRMVPAWSVFGRPFRIPIYVANFLFCPRRVLAEIRPDPHIFFYGEEINFSARLWTHGYDIFHVDRPILYHYWNRAGATPAGALEWTYGGKWDHKNGQSLRRNLHLLQVDACHDPEVLHDLDAFALGEARSIASFWDFAHLPQLRSVPASA